MEHATLDRHRCLDPRCRRAFAVVYSPSSVDMPAWLALACPHCGTRHTLMIASDSLGERDGAYVVPLEGTTALTA